VYPDALVGADSWLMQDDFIWPATAGSDGPCGARIRFALTSIGFVKIRVLGNVIYARSISSCGANNPTSGHRYKTLFEQRRQRRWLGAKIASSYLE
jgi:hypothetical protein